MGSYMEVKPFIPPNRSLNGQKVSSERKDGGAFITDPWGNNNVNIAVSRWSMSSWAPRDVNPVKVSVCPVQKLGRLALIGYVILLCQRPDLASEFSLVWIIWPKFTSVIKIIIVVDRRNFITFIYIANVPVIQPIINTSERMV